MQQILAPSIHELATTAVVFSIRHSLLWYRIPAAAAALLLLFASLAPARPKPGAAAGRLWFGELGYLLALAVFLLAARWPMLALGDLEGDESVAVSAALTRFVDPVFGVGLFTGSAGPLLTYPVAGMGLLGIRIDYGASKLIVLLLATASSAMLYRALRTFSEARTARVALLPLLVFLGLSNTRWTMSYCSEQWINLLVISMLLCLLRLDRRIGREAVNLSGIGLALGAMPLVKWQGLPMAALFVAWAALLVAQRCHRERAGFRRLAIRLLPLAALGLAPLLVWCAILWSCGSLGFFFETYFTALFSQATSRYSTTMLERLLALPEWGIAPFALAEWFWFANALFAVPAAIGLCFVRRAGRCLPDLVLAALYLGISLYAVLQPGGLFTHYLNLLVQPSAVLLMLIFCHLASAVPRPALVQAAYLGLTALIPTLAYLQEPPLPIKLPPVEVRALSINALRSLHVSGLPIIQWGWVYAYYVQTGATWGSRTGGSHEILEPFFPDKSIFIADYVASLESGRAPVFVDTATEGAPSYAIRALYGHETVPEVADAVRRNYFPCAEFRGARLYLERKRYGDSAEIHAWCAHLPQWRPPAKA